MRGRPPKNRPAQVEGQEPQDQPQAVRVPVHAGISGDQITDENIKAIEAELCTGRAHWGVIDPKRIVAACLNVCGKGVR
jgi:hypothetical protein